MVVKQDKVPFEDALRMTGFGKFNVVAFLVCSSIIVGMVFEIFSVSYLVPASGCELGTTSSQQGLIAGVPLLGIIATSHVWGYLADTQGRRKILVISMSLAFLSGSLAALSPNWIVLSLFKFCSSASVSGAFALSMTLLSEYTPKEKTSILVLLTTSVFLSSQGLMAVFSIPILPLTFSHYIPYLNIHFNSWRLLDLMFALPCLIGALGVAWSYESPKYLMSVGRDAEALEVLKGIFAINSGKDRELYRVNSVVLDEEGSASAIGFWASIKSQTLPMIRPPLRFNFILLSIMYFIVYFCINPFFVWLPFMVNAFMSSVNNGVVDVTLCEMIRQSMNSSSYSTIEQPSDCSMNTYAMVMVIGISMIIAVLNLVTSGIVNCLGRKGLFFGLQFLGAISVVAIIFSTSWQLSAACFVVFLTGIINFGTLTTFSVDLFPTYVKAMAVCLTVMVGRGSAILGINLLKKLLDDNCEAAFYIFGGIAFVGAFISLWLPSDAKIEENKQILKEKFTSHT